MPPNGALYNGRTGVDAGRLKRAYVRYRSKGKQLELPESERLFRYLRLLQRRRKIFGSDRKAAWWMTKPGLALDERTPVEVALTAWGPSVPAPAPRPDLITERYEYSSWSNITHERYADAPFSGEDGLHYGSRWASKRRRVSYAADHLATATLEKVAGVQRANLLAEMTSSSR